MANTMNLMNSMNSMYSMYSMNATSGLNELHTRLLTVCIASIGRASLLETIRGVRACKRPAGFSLEIVVADDSKQGAATTVLAGLNGDSSDPVADFPDCPLRIVYCGAQNISLARNTCMAHSTGDYLIFIDDDEVPGVDWLESLVHIAERTSADAVQGSVVGCYPGNAPRWAARLRPFDKTYGATGARIEVGSTCNLLLRRASLVLHGLQFSPAFGRSGGEDTDLCYRLTSAGGRIVCSPAAVVYENVPLERLVRWHLVRRYARGGHTYAGVVLARKGRLRRLAELGKAALLTVGYGGLTAASSLVMPATAMRYALRLSGNVGKLTFFLGLPAWHLY